MSREDGWRRRRRAWFWICMLLGLLLILFYGLVWVGSSVGLSEARHAEFQYNLRPALMEHLGRPMTFETTMEFEKPILLESTTHILVISQTEIRDRGRAALLYDKQGETTERLILEQW